MSVKVLPPMSVALCLFLSPRTYHTAPFKNNFSFIYLVKALVFPVVMYGCQSWTVKKAECQRIDAFELRCWRRLLRALDGKEIQPVHSEGDQPWVFFGRHDAKAETPVLWPPHAKS